MLTQMFTHSISSEKKGYERIRQRARGTRVERAEGEEGERCHRRARRAYAKLPTGMREEWTGLTIGVLVLGTVSRLVLVRGSES